MSYQLKVFVDEVAVDEGFVVINKKMCWNLGEMKTVLRQKLLEEQ